MNLSRGILRVCIGLAIAAVSGGSLSHAAAKEKQIYSESADAHAEIKEALVKASAEHKRVIVVFGANWCYDCHVLDDAFHRPELASIIKASYDVPMKRGIPGLAVLDGDGKLVYSQKNGEFENARALSADDFREFLNKWKPGA